MIVAVGLFSKQVVLSYKVGSTGMAVRTGATFLVLMQNILSPGIIKSSPRMYVGSNVLAQDDTSYVAESVSMSEFGALSTWNKNETPTEPILRADTSFHRLVGILSAKYMSFAEPRIVNT
jgi:hypothetical protein